MAEISTPTYRIRYATESDVPTILQLINELASYEKALHEVLATEQTLRETLSFPDAKAQGGFSQGYAKTLLIEPVTGASSGETVVAGMALYFHNYSTWRAAPGIFLEDLFVRPAYRGKGFGGALIQALARECLRLGCKRLEWSVLKWNEPSIQFYQGPSINATRMEEWVGMRVDGEPLEELARRGPNDKNGRVVG
ncbi:GNAT family acetyltransferase [Exophiala viscosa]|uniref:GNAT family acetyltransferase n=1 Tax=Exophiala viscosa TaxID=2486360 RepID=UPI00218EB0DE|nr:GNAT family acetyltransferase [Exophiala viscosa]